MITKAALATCFLFLVASAGTPGLMLVSEPRLGITNWLGLDSQGLSFRDSAGVRILEYGPELPRDLARWTVGPRPMVSIGTAGSDEAHIFARVVQVILSADGQVVVADAGTKDIRVFDPAGKMTRRFGREGSGPGEFRSLNWAAVDGSGAIETYDYTLRRRSRFSVLGELIGTTPVPALPGIAGGTVAGRFADGSLLMRGPLLVAGEDDPKRIPTGLVRDSIGLVLIAPKSDRVVPLGHFPGDQAVRMVDPPRVAQVPAPFGLRTVVGISDSVFHLSDQSAFEIRTYSRQGRLLRILRRKVQLSPVSTAAGREWIRRQQLRLVQLRRSPAVPRVLELVNDYQTLPEFFPAHGDIRVDYGGNLWVQEYEPFPDPGVLINWIVFDAQGKMIATAQLPAMAAIDIGSDGIAGVWPSDHDVPYVKVYRLLKSR